MDTLVANACLREEYNEIIIFRHVIFISTFIMFEFYNCVFFVVCALLHIVLERNSRRIWQYPCFFSIGPLYGKIHIKEESLFFLDLFPSRLVKHIFSTISLIKRFPIEHYVQLHEFCVHMSIVFLHTPCPDGINYNNVYFPIYLEKSFFIKVFCLF